MCSRVVFPSVAACRHRWRSFLNSFKARLCEDVQPLATCAMGVERMVGECAVERTTDSMCFD